MAKFKSLNMITLSFEQVKAANARRNEEGEVQQIQKFLQLSKLNGKVNNDISEIVLNAANLSRAIISICDICKIGNYLYAYDHETGLMIDLLSKIDTLISHLVTKYNDSGMFKISNVSKLKVDVFSLIVPRMKEFRDAKIAPNHLILTRDHKCLDFKKKSIIDEPEMLKQYDFFYRSPCKIVTLDNFTTSQEKDKYSFLKSVKDQVFSEWSNGSEEELLFIKEISYAIVCGMNLEKMIFLMGSGGNGKSSFLELNTALVGQKHVVNINLQQFNDDNALNKISQSTRFLNGDDLSKKGLSDAKLISNFKTIVGGNSLSVNKKYQDNVDIQSNALLLQATNHEPDFSEFSDAIRSRAIFHNWGAKSFRGKDTYLNDTEISFSLREVLKDQLFIDIYFTEIFETVDPFSQFHVPSKSENLMNDVLKDADIFSQFIDDLQVQTIGWREIPIRVAFEYMKKWAKSNAPHLLNMKINSFSKEMKNRISSKLAINENRLKFDSSKYAYMRVLCDVLNVDREVLSYQQQSLLYIEEEQITEEEALAFDKKPGDDLTDRDISIIKYKAHVLNDSTIMSEFASYL